jgi:predicted transcriptional regulator
MHTRWLTLPILAALTLLAPAAAASTPLLDFATPAQVSGILAGDGLKWALLIFHGGVAAFHVDLAANVYYTNSSRLVAGAQGNQEVMQAPYLDAHGESLPRPLAAELAMGGGWSALLVVADRIRLDAGAAVGSLNEAPPQSVPLQALPPRSPYPADTVRTEYRLLERQAALGLAPREGEGMNVGLRAEGVRLLEWHNATVSCTSSGPCPDGAGVTGEDHGTPVARLRVQRYYYSQVASANGTLEGQGTAYIAAAGGGELALQVGGSLRLPVANLQAPCDGCLDPGGGTLQATGNLTLEGLTPGGSDRLRARVSGLESVRIDEASVTVPVAAVVATTGALAVVGALLARAVAALVGRTRVQDVLESPRRRALFERILAHPGLSLRELQRQQGWGIGTTVHHLRHLVRAGHVVAQPYGHTVRYFENHGRYQRTWRAVAVLADARLGGLHAWLLGHAGASQREVVGHARVAWGWGRSATQDRLQALVREGLAEARSVGRRTVYVARPQPVEPVGGAGLAGEAQAA